MTSASCQKAELFLLLVVRFSSFLHSLFLYRYSEAFTVIVCPPDLSASRSAILRTHFDRLSRLDAASSTDNEENDLKKKPTGPH